MADQRCGDVARSLAGTGTRRGAVRGLIGGALAGAMAMLGARSAGAKPGAGSCFRKGRRCRHDSQCCSGKCGEGVCAGPPNRNACRPAGPPPGGTCTPRCRDVAKPGGPNGCGGT